MGSHDVWIYVLLSDVHLPRVVQILGLAAGTSGSLPHVLLRIIQVRDSQIGRALRDRRSVWAEVNVRLSRSFSSSTNSNCNSTMRVWHLNLNTSLCITTLPTFVNNPLIDCIVTHLGLRDYLLPVLFWHFNLLACILHALWASPWPILTHDVPSIRINLLRGGRLGVGLLIWFPY